MQTTDITDPLFRQAVEAIDSGDIATVKRLLQANPGLATKRLESPTEGYFARPYLLWFVADNPIRHNKLPANITEIAQAIIVVLKDCGDENYQHIIDYTMGLVVTGRIPKECGVQIPLMELLVSNGAQVKGSVLGSIGQHNFEAAEWLLSKGSDYDVATAVGLNRFDDAQQLATTATPAQLYVALVVAAFFGRVNMIAMLIAAGADVNGSATGKDFGGFHGHASPLHQAIYSGSLEAVRLLIEANASLTATDKAYNGTPLGWAMYMQTEEVDDNAKAQYKAIENYLLSVKQV